jgi:hypothetical protein
MSTLRVNSGTSTVAYIRTSSAANVGTDKDSDKRQRAAIEGFAKQAGNADRFAKNVAPIIKEIQGSGIASRRAIARALNARGVATVRGGRWTAVQIANASARSIAPHDAPGLRFRDTAVDACLVAVGAFYQTRRKPMLLPL